MSIDSCEPVAPVRGRIAEDVGLSFDDVLLRPRLGVLEHRADADTSTFLFASQKIATPIIGAPMSSIMNQHIAARLVKAGAAAVIHRFQTKEEQYRQWHLAGRHDAVLCAVGHEPSRYEYLVEQGVKRFYLDVAHGHQKQSCRTLRLLKSLAPGLRVMAGSVATGDGALYLTDSGADAITVGIGPGSACTTRAVTGYGVPLLTSLLEVAEAVEWAAVAVVCNGGVRTSGDIVKALAAGADTVMTGRLLAGVKGAPGEGRYWGEASKRANGHRQPEGVELEIEQTDDTAADVVERLTWGIKSGISYSGGTDIQTLRRGAVFQRVAPGVATESGVR